MAPGELGLVDRRIADVLPRRSGELIFEAEWEKRGFGMGVALVEQGVVPFDDLRWRVVAAISLWERANLGQEETFRFAERWLIALEKLLVDRGIVSREEIEKKIAERRARDG
ncbi:MAG: nitrile hydratase accessory protein [Chloroflexi bacterium]|nr:nitrile hydratase accessory protein [Chloroflexota bacterium]